MFLPRAETCFWYNVTLLNCNFVFGLKGPPGCADEMEPQVPAGSSPVPTGEEPVRYVQLINVPEGTYVEEIPAVPGTNQEVLTPVVSTKYV